MCGWVSCGQASQVLSGGSAQPCHFCCLIFSIQKANGTYCSLQILPEIIPSYFLFFLFVFFLLIFSVQERLIQTKISVPELKGLRKTSPPFPKNDSGQWLLSCVYLKLGGMGWGGVLNREEEEGDLQSWSVRTVFGIESSQPHAGRKGKAGSCIRRSGDLRVLVAA